MAAEPTTTEPAEVAAVAEPVAGTPLEQPATTDSPAAPPTTPQVPTVDVAALQAAFTQSTQISSAALRELGLAKGATPEQVAAAIRVLKTPVSDDPTLNDPRVQQAIARAQEAEWRAQQSLYGQTATDARAFAEEVRTLGDPEEIVARFHAAVTRVSTAAAPAPVVEQPAPPAAPETPVDLDVPTGGYGMRQPTFQVDDSLRGTGKTAEFFKRLRGQPS